MILRFTRVCAASILAAWAASGPAESAFASGGASDVLDIRRGLYVEAARRCDSTAARAKTYDGVTLQSAHAGRCRTEVLWSLQGVQRLRQACLVEDGRWRETGRPYLRVLDRQTFEIVEVRPNVAERPPAGRRAARYRHCPAAR
ncbi:hypothetical protein ABOZ73_15890 [Caulobacter sp. 73W]|uniref:DUF3617 family protein n=1 Tax=Caulobacter sp. 73W TaxID=3161137 RepID=A0AB39KQZ5_9CAUL